MELTAGEPGASMPLPQKLTQHDRARRGLSRDMSTDSEVGSQPSGAPHPEDRKSSHGERVVGRDDEPWKRNLETSRRSDDLEQ